MPEKESIESSKGFTRLKEMAFFNKDKQQNSSQNQNQRSKKDFGYRLHSNSYDSIKNSESKYPTSESSSQKFFGVDNESTKVPSQSQRYLPYSTDNPQLYLMASRSIPVSVEDFANTSSESGHLRLKRKEGDLSRNLLTEGSGEIVSVSEISNSNINNFMEAFDELEDIDNNNRTNSPKVERKTPLSMESILSFDITYDISKYELSQANLAEVINYKPENIRQELSDDKENSYDKKHQLGFLKNQDKSSVLVHNDQRKADIEKEIANVSTTYHQEEGRNPDNEDFEEQKSRSHDSGPSFDSTRQKERSSGVDSRANILEVALSSKRSTASNSFDPNETVLKEYNDQIPQDSQRKSYFFNRTLGQSNESMVAQHDRLSNIVPIKDMSFLGMLTTDNKSNTDAPLPVHISYQDNEAYGDTKGKQRAHVNAPTTQKDDISNEESFNTVSQSNTHKTLSQSSDKIGASEKQRKKKNILSASLPQYPPVNNHVSDEWSKRSSKASSLLHSPFMENILTHDLEKNPGNTILKKQSLPSHSWTAFTFFMFGSLVVPPMFFLVFVGFFDLTPQAANAHYYREFYNSSLHKNYHKSFTNSQKITSLILGLLWSLIILAMIGVGLGVGLSRECRESCSS